MACTASLIFSMMRSGPTWYGSSVTTRPVRRGPSDSIATLPRAWNVPRPRRVGILDAVEAQHDPARREVGARHELHQLVDGRVGVLEQMDRRRDDLDEVVRRHVRRHADRDAGRAVDEQVRVGRGQHRGLLELAVVVGDEVDDVLVEVLGEGERRGREPGLGVPRRGGAVVERAEVAVAVHERHAQRERLREAHEGVVDRRVAVRVQLSHDLADDARALDVPAVGTKAHVGHLVQDASLHRLQPVAGVRERAGVDHRVGVLEERPLHLGRDVDVFDALFDGGSGVGAGCGHGSRASGDDRPASEIQPAGASRRCARLARMSLSLPAEPSRARSLTRVVPELIAALDGRSEWFAPATSAVLFVVDGLGARNLAARAGHGRFLAAAGSKKDTARTVFPSTTAAALTSLLTGTDPGVHGIVGYRVRIPGTDSAPNQLKGWETDGLDPHAWQRAQPLLERESLAGRPCFVVSRAGVRRLRVHRGDPARSDLRLRRHDRRARRARRRPRGAASGCPRVSVRA